MTNTTDPFADDANLQQIDVRLHEATSELLQNYHTAEVLGQLLLATLRIIYSVEDTDSRKEMQWEYMQVYRYLAIVDGQLSPAEIDTPLPTTGPDTGRIFKDLWTSRTDLGAGTEHMANDNRQCPDDRNPE